MAATPLAACDATTATLPDGRVLLSFGGCNYLGLANHPAVAAAVAQAMGRYGMSSSASRETTGNTLAHEALEHELAAFLACERVLLVPDGYTANIAACQAMAGVCSHALLDDKAHVSLRDAARAAGLESLRFTHLDPASLRTRLAEIRPGRAVVLTDGVFTADGALAPLAELLAALGQDDRLIIDDCHGFGVLGPGGRGSPHHAGLRDPRIIVTSSLAKGLGCAGGMVAGPAAEIARAARGTAYFCTTPTAPPMAEGTRASLAILAAEPQRVERLAANAERLQARLHDLGLAAPPRRPATPIAAFTIGTKAQMELVHAGLLAEGIRAPLISYPGGPAEAYFRLTLTAEHSPQHIDFLAAALATQLQRLPAAPHPSPLPSSPHCSSAPAHAQSQGPHPRWHVPSRPQQPGAPTRSELQRGNRRFLAPRPRNLTPKPSPVRSLADFGPSPLPPRSTA
ncbi:MAG: pyridoxal phosphate-dependent aminotransferase family protein [Phycisphaerales bacterium]|nr:pyridoxal phosphate-dependent aminotransferase family protein [Phycisphaerales bacterium]